MLRSTANSDQCYSLPDNRQADHADGMYPIGIDESLQWKPCDEAKADDKGVFYFDQDLSDKTQFRLRPKLSANNDLDICLSLADGQTEK